MKIIQKKMLLALACAIVMVGCEKKSIDSEPEKPLTTSANSKSRGIQIALNSVEQAKLAEIIKAGGIKDSADFVAKVNEIKTQNVRARNFLSSTNSTDNESEGYFEGEEEANFASFYTVEVQEVNEYDPNYSSVLAAIPQSQGIPLKGFKGVAMENKRFAIRGNLIMFTIPYVAVVKMSGNPTVVRISEQLGAPPYMSSAGPFWGEYTPNPYPAYVQSLYGNAASVHAQGSEKRTVIYGTNGNMKLSVNTNLQLYQAGMELEAGFTITSSSNTYNNYVMTGTFSLAILSMDYYNGGEPTFGLISSIKCTQTGILRNQ